MSTQTLTLQDAKKIFPHLDEAGKKILIDKLGEEALAFDPVEEIVSLEVACTHTGADRHTAVPYETPANDDQECINAFAALIQINRAFNQNKKKLWGSNTPPKYYPWWNMPTPSGVGLSFYGAAFDYSRTVVPARLTLLNRSHVEVVAKRFPQLFEKLMVEK